MAFKRYSATKDNTITNSFQGNLTVRGTGSNMGQADILEVFYIYAQQSATSEEKARILLEFPISDLSTDRANGLIPASGSVSFFLKMTNAKHSTTLPRDYKLTVHGTSGSWQEGRGLDMEEYTDLTYDNTGSNWIRREGSTSWDTEGGDFYTDSSSSFDVTFTNGDEDLEVDVTTLVEQWIDSAGNVLGSKDNHGFLIKLSSSYESSTTDSYYTKKFFARSSEFFFRRPVLEARWDSSQRDNRGNLHYSSSLLPAEHNLMNLYMYNYFRGNLYDIAGDSDQIPVLNLYYSSGSVPEGDARYFRDSSNDPVNFLSASRVSKGLYKATFSITSSIVTSTYPYLVDVWTYSGSEVHTGSAMTPQTHDFSNYNPNPSYVISMPNLKKGYFKNETERFRLYVREKGWSPNIYTVASTATPTLMIESASYKVIRVSDEKVVIPYNTGSDYSTMLSYDSEGNYFDLDMSVLEPGYTFAFQFTFYEDSVGSYREQPHIFKFRMIEEEL
jgi:hypothetical protein